MTLRERFRGSGLLGVRFAVNVFIGSSLLWALLSLASGLDPIWAIASLVAASEPQVKDAVRMFRSRIVNVLLGCAVGLAVLLVGTTGAWKLPLAISLAVLVSSYLVHVQTMWRQAPITAAIVIAAGLTGHSKLSGAEHGLQKVAEVILGCVVGLCVSWALARLWPLPDAAPPAKVGAGGI